MTPLPPATQDDAHRHAVASFEKLLVMMDELREQCPWDREQTWQTLRTLTLEETAELSEAILEGSPDHVAKELGDLLLHIVFYGRLALEEQSFTLGQVIDRLMEKLVRRHPHIYGTTQADDAHAVKANWEEIKLKEGTGSVLAGVPAGLSSLVKAYRMQEKAAAVGFDWPNAHGPRQKVEEELKELDQAQTEANLTAMQDELGDVLFSLVNLARHLGLNPDDALEATNRKFRRRFQWLEQQAQAQGTPLKSLPLAQLEALWQAAKAHPAQP